jgi:hypothetical protein
MTRAGRSLGFELGFGQRTVSSRTWGIFGRNIFFLVLRLRLRPARSGDDATNQPTPSQTVLPPFLLEPHPDPTHGFRDRGSRGHHGLHLRSGGRVHGPRRRCGGCRSGGGGGRVAEERCVHGGGVRGSGEAAAAGGGRGPAGQRARRRGLPRAPVGRSQQPRSRRAVHPRGWPLPSLLTPRNFGRGLVPLSTIGGFGLGGFRYPACRSIVLSELELCVSEVQNRGLLVR